MRRYSTIQEIAQRLADYEGREAFVYKTPFRTFRYSYGDVAEYVKQTRALLEEMGVVKGDRVLIWGGNSPWWTITFLACVAQGVVVVPLDNLAREDYVRKINEQVSAKVIFRTRYKVDPELSGVRTVLLDELELLLLAPRPPALLPPLSPDDIAEIVFTSGTTDAPKGVVLTHGNITANLASMNEFILISPSQTFLSLLPLSHLFEQNPGCLLELTNGARVVYLQVLKPSAIFRALAEERITNMVIVPRLLQLMADGIWHKARLEGRAKLLKKLLSLAPRWPRWIRRVAFAKVHRSFGRHFLYFVSGGAALAPELEAFWTAMGFTILQGYGLTECAPVLTCNPLKHSRPGSAGVALPGVELKLAADGEVLARGANITPGYYHEPEKTSALFQDGWMRTGDIGFFDGPHLFLKGRSKNVIVTSSGMNVYPEDIELALTKQPEIKDACVFAVPGSRGEEVVAVLLPREPASFDARATVIRANEQLNTAQQINDYWVWPKEDFPRTTTMKVQRRFVLEGLKTRNTTRAAADDLGAALTDRQRKLYRIVAEVTRQPIADIRGDQRLGLDLHLSSIGRVELVSYLEQEFSLDIDEEMITNQFTVADLETMVAKRERVDLSQAQRNWVFTSWWRIIRTLHHYLFAWPVQAIFLRLRVEGAKYLQAVAGPAIFVSNHTGFLDTPTIYRALPGRFATKIAAGAHREFFEKTRAGRTYIPWYSFAYNYSTMFMGVYLFPRTKEFKLTLEYTGKLLDKGWNILIFPEGKHTKTGAMQQFKTGVGAMATAMGVPVVPIKLEGLYQVLNWNTPYFRTVTVKFGAPLSLRNMSAEDATAAIRSAVDRL